MIPALSSSKHQHQQQRQQNKTKTFHTWIRFNILWLWKNFYRLLILWLAIQIVHHSIYGLFLILLTISHGKRNENLSKDTLTFSAGWKAIYIFVCKFHLKLCTCKKRLNEPEMEWKKKMEIDQSFVEKLLCLHTFA